MFSDRETDVFARRNLTVFEIANEAARATEAAAQPLLGQMPSVAAGEEFFAEGEKEPALLGLTLGPP